MPFCSWCLKDVNPSVAESSLLTRNLLRCPHCQRTVVECRACKNLACWDSYTISTSEGRVKHVRQHDHFCAEHRHAVRNFQKLEAKLQRPDEYRTVYDFHVSDMAKHAKAAFATLGGIVIAGPLAFIAGPALGGAIGALGLGLQGAAATSAGLALIGGGSLAAGGLGMAGGLAILSVVGAGVGGSLGAYIAGQYLSDVSEFDIYRGSCKTRLMRGI